MSGFADQLSWLRTRLSRAAEGREEDGTARYTFFKEHNFHKYIQALSRVKHILHITTYLGFHQKVKRYVEKQYSTILCS